MALSSLEKGLALSVESGGLYYAAEVVAVSTAKNRAKAPVKVHYRGYADTEDEWVPVDRIRSKALNGAAAGKKDGKAGALKEKKPKEKKEQEEKPEKDDGREAVDELVSAAWVIPVETDDVLQDHTVVIHEGKIKDILPISEAKKKYRGRKNTRIPRGALMPGFVNAHTHTPMVYLRGISDDIPLRDWLEGTIWPLEFKFVNADFVREGAELAIVEMLLGGVTTFNDMYWFPEAVCDAVVRSGIRAAIGVIAIEFPFGSYGSGPDDYFAKGEKMMEQFKAESRISWTISLHAPFTISDATLEKGKALSEKHDTPLHMHIHETEDEPKDSAKGDRESKSCHLSDQKLTPLANMKRLGMLNKRLMAVHMNWLTDEEIRWCGEEGVNVIHCPSSNLKLASGFCRVDDLQKAGVNVALGTDGASSNNTLDVMAEMKLASLVAKAVAKDAKAVPANLALRMATLNGAKALGLDKVTGSLVVGKEADMIAVDFGQPPSWPAPTSADPSLGFDPVTHIVYSSTRDQVTDVWVKGKRLLRNRRVTTLKVGEVRKAAQKWGAEITKAVGEMRK
mmetsp:Transcript_93291/g.201816  ORF Transcript_93291/g.201816 Transcript_93291/m.201816 type:complete len:564 (-) Transcript_93291:34-1725(-)